jgi:hypothetical protein
MKTIQLLTVMCLVVFTNPIFADDDGHHGKSGMSMGDDQDCSQMSGMKQEKMKGMMQMKKKHMQAMEDRLANIEGLLKQLVEIEKQKGAVR